MLVNGSNGGGDPLAMLISAAVDQVVNTTTDAAHNHVAGPAAYRLFGEENHGLPPGPRYPKEEKSQ